ncbi:hypothetical protein [Planktothricoides raciborskii]|uniref:Uncharacterized protein n=1 Tax=Planktothricoides raciborskii GIHE-MW2 TaxID=2792601 RepID=A0AAU8JK69_9CYAN
MNIMDIVEWVIDKENFCKIEDYIDFTKDYLEFVKEGLQAVIVSQNENHYEFYQYDRQADFRITRPLNSSLMYSANEESEINEFLEIIKNIRDIPKNDFYRRKVIIRSIYTFQQCIGAALDALPVGQSNRARKINGDLFERLIQLLIKRVGVHCRTGTIQVPVKIDGQTVFNMQYQHDLLINALENPQELRAIGSVKTSSKDRIGKIFVDKLLYSKLTGTSLPHIAIFLNDVQRKKTSEENEYGINSTFLSGHFKGYTVNLNPLDGVYYCDIRPNMQTEPILKEHIKTIDHFFCSDLWLLVQ